MFAAAVWLVNLFILIGLAFYAIGALPGFIPICFFGLLYGWVIYAFFRYRYGRQDEFLHLVTTAVESGAPLAPALRSYLADRPHGPVREFWVGFFLFFILPGYYWLWYRGHNYDRKIARVAELLEQGSPLSDALRLVPGVASRDAILAAVIGENTGQLAYCLRNSNETRLTTVWLQVLPRLLYPMIILIFVCSITTFWLLFIGPKIERIFRDFKLPLPTPTARILNFAALASDYWWLWLLCFLGILTLVMLALSNSRSRWYFPGLGRLYRMQARSRVLQMLSVLLGVGKTVPQGLQTLVESGSFAASPRRRLEGARHAIEDGEPFSEGLHDTGLLPGSMIPLVEAAQRAQNLPWALNELGKSQSSRAAKLLERASVLLAPLVLISIGVVVGYFVVGAFIPIVAVITGNAE
jgi:type II secretory pathway component PulF